MTGYHLFFKSGFAISGPDFVYKEFGKKRVNADIGGKRVFEEICIVALLCVWLEIFMDENAFNVLISGTYFL